jgi:hypothetical protein
VVGSIATTPPTLPVCHLLFVQGKGIAHLVDNVHKRTDLALAKQREQGRRNSGYLVTTEIPDSTSVPKVLAIIKQKVQGWARNDKDVFRNAQMVFVKFDQNADGVLDKAELAHMIRVFFALKLSDKKQAALFKFFDTDRSGTISRDEFCSAFLDSEDDNFPKADGKHSQGIVTLRDGALKRDVQDEVGAEW